MSYSIANSFCRLATKLLSASKTVRIPAAAGLRPAQSTLAFLSQNGPSWRPFTRSMWYMCSRRENAETPALENLSRTCSCGCGIKRIHTKGDKELFEFLKEEIAAERKNQKITSLPSQLQGFTVSTDHAELLLTKNFNDETITISLNVNHTVDADSSVDELNPNLDKQEPAVMKSKPNFEVDIKKDTKTLSFTCSYVQEPLQESTEEDAYSDIFTIDEVAVFENKWEDKMYAVAGDILDGYLYDLMMNMLEERGVTNEFVGHLSDFCSGFEQKLYVDMLEDLQKFVSGH